jgi:hypothetical protein
VLGRYKALNDPTALSAMAEEVRTRYPDTSWAKKASVWAHWRDGRHLPESFG